MDEQGAEKGALKDQQIANRGGAGFQPAGAFFRILLTRYPSRNSIVTSLRAYGEGCSGAMCWNPSDSYRRIAGLST
jgi:hypothetical protein